MGLSLTTLLGRTRGMTWELFCCGGGRVPPGLLGVASLEAAIEFSYALGSTDLSERRREAVSRRVLLAGAGPPR